MQAVADTHETPSIKGWPPPGGMGTGTKDQLAPSQATAKGRTSLLTSPTAMQNEADVHDTEDRVSSDVPAGAGTLCTVQPLPVTFRTASGSPTRLFCAFLVTYEPTAVHVPFFMQDTPFSAWPSVPGCGTGWIVQLPEALATGAPPITRAAAAAVIIKPRRLILVIRITTSST